MCLFLVLIAQVSAQMAEQSESKYGAIDLAFGGKCTTIAVSKGASLEGPMVTHTSDCADCDFRVNKMKAQTHAKDSVRTLYEYKGNYPATVTTERSTNGGAGTWDPSNLQGTDEQKLEWGVGEKHVTGTLPEVEETYAVIEGGYGMINEHQLIMGESTCAAKLWATPKSQGGAAQIEVRELSRVALERTKTARDAIALMGATAEELGFYSADWSGGDASRGEGGEALTVADTEEAWVFHILPDDTGTSAVWVAQQVPDGEVAAVANQFVIRAIDPAQRGKTLLYSDNIHAVAEKMGWYDSDKDGLLDFTAAYAPPRAHAPYATRRVWRVFNMVAPSVVLPADTTPLADDYPFSVPVDKKIGPRDLMRINRDHYQGTQFDLSKGIAAGPYGDPNRFDPAPVDGMTMMHVLNGSFERPISMFRTSTSIVAQSRGHLPNAIGARVWLGVYNPASSSYVPMYPASSGELPKAYTTGSLFKYDDDVAFWNFCAVGNYAARFYKYAMQDVVKTIDALEDLAFASAAAAEENALRLMKSDDVADAMNILTDCTNSLVGAVQAGWKSLLPELITKYHDGYHAQNLDQASITMTKLFYPEAWLKAVGYFNMHPNVEPGMIWFAPTPPTHATVAWNVLVLAIGGMMGAYIMLRSMKHLDCMRREGYSRIDTVEML